MARKEQIAIGGAGELIGILNFFKKTIDAKLKLQIATELRDTIDSYQNQQEYPKFLAKMIPVFSQILKQPPVFSSSSPDQVCQFIYLPQELFFLPLFIGVCVSVWFIN